MFGSAVFMSYYLSDVVSVIGFAFDRFTAHGGPVRDLALSPDGQNFVTASFDYSAVLWSTNDIKEK